MARRFALDGQDQARRRAMPRRLLAAGLVLGLAGGAALAQSGGGKADADAGKAPPPAVTVAAVTTRSVGRQGRFIGTIKAIQSVDLKARVEGFLEQVAFDQGSMVEQGALLYQIEQAPYQADLASAEGQLAAAKANLDSAQASLEDKQANFERQSVLIKKGDTSQTAFDQSKAERDEAKAAVEQAKASIQQAEASVASAKINLGYTTVTSPIKGRIGATHYTVGNLVDANSGTLATVVQLDPIRAVFSIPSADFVRIQQQLGGKGPSEARGDFVPELILPTGDTYGNKGRIAFADNQVDAGTGTVAVYADFPNPDGVLLPGQFVTALVQSRQEQHLPVVPAAAIQRTRDGVQVYVVDGDNRIVRRSVELGRRAGTGYAVTSGLQDGEIVVVSGIQKVKAGQVVNPVRESEAKAGGAAAAQPASGAESGAAAAGSDAARAESSK
jgi:membrane fusion protein (multidrug efflux system)